MNSFVWSLMTVIICRSAHISPQSPHTPRGQSVAFGILSPQESTPGYTSPEIKRTPPRTGQMWDDSSILDFGGMSSSTMKETEVLSLNLTSEQLQDLMPDQNIHYFTNKFHSVESAQERILNDPSEAEGQAIIFMQDQRTKSDKWYKLKIQQNIIVYGAAFCPPHKMHFENLRLVYPYYDHIIIGIQSNSQERHGYNYETIKKIWNIYNAALLPEHERKVTIIPVGVDSRKEPFEVLLRYALKQFEPGKEMIRLQIPSSRIDVLMGPDNAKNIVDKTDKKWLQKAETIVKACTISRSNRRGEDPDYDEDDEFTLDTGFVIPRTMGDQDAFCHATNFVRYIPLQQTTENLSYLDKENIFNFLPNGLSQGDKERVLKILLNEKCGGELDWYNGSGSGTDTVPRRLTRLVPFERGV